MPTNSRVFLKPFIGGLNTEGSDTDDMVLNTSDELNCTILPEQMRGRRYGFNIEKDGKWIESNVTDNLTGSIYYWKNVSKTDLDLIVCRIGYKLYFFDASIKPISDSEAIGEVSLEDYIIDTNQFYTEKFGFATGDGKLTVVNRWMQPVRIIYDINSAEFIVESFTLSIRDIEGVVDTWGVKSSQQLVDELNEEPSKPITAPTWTITDSSIANIYVPYCTTSGDCYLKKKREGLDKQFQIGPLTKTAVGTETHVFYDGKDIGVYQSNGNIYGGSKEHFYNLLNQGWTIGDLTKFSQAMTAGGMSYIWPDNTMAVSVGRDNTGAYNTGDVVYTYLGNTQQPRGHFILDYFKMNRSEVSGIWDISNAATAEYSFQHTWVRSRSIRGEMITNHSTTIEDSQGTASRVVLKWTKLYRKSAKKSWDLHWRGNIEIKVYGLLDGVWTLITTRQAYSSDGASAESPLVETIDIDNLQTVYNKYKVDVRYYNGNGTSDYPQPLGVTMTASVWTTDADSGDYFYKSGDSSRIIDVAYMSGKYFYLCKDSVLFSQTVKENGTGFDKCYQDADPTSTEVSDILTTDGGYVKFNTMGRGLALKTFNRGVLVFGRDVVYGLISPLESRFTAVDYDILELSRAGLISPESVVSTTQQVYYWSPTGIYTIGVNPETGSTIFAQSISLNTIQTYYNNLAQYSKEHCKGVYDYTTNRIYWYFPTNADALNNLDGCLVYDLTYNCFMPQKIADSDGYFNLDATEVSQSYEIEPTVYLRAGGNRVVAGGDKVLAVDETTTDYHRWTSVQHLIAKHSDNGYIFSIGDFNDREFHDWEKTDYSSYLISRPITLGDTYWNKQTPIMQTLFKRTEEYKLKDIVNTDTVYKQSPIVYNISGQDWTTYVHVFNTGLFKEATANINLSGFDRSLNLVSCVVYGFNGTNFIQIGRTDKYNVEPVSSYSISVECDEQYATTSFSKFKMFIQVHAYDPITGVMPTCTTSFKLERTDMTEGKYVGMVGKVYSGTNSMTKTSSSRYTLKVDTHEDAIFNWVDVTYAPIITTFFPFPEGAPWTGTGSFTAEGGIDLGVSESLSNNSYILHGDNYDNPNIYNSWSIFMDGLTAESGGVLKGVIATYNIGVWVPKFEATTVPVYAKYTTPSGAIIRMRWGWSLNPLSNRWDMMQNGYRPQKDFLHDDYVESRLHIRGRGKAFQIEIRNDDNRDFRLTGLNIITRSPQ